MTTPEYLAHEIEYRNAAVLQKRSSVDIRVLGAGALGSWLVDWLSRQGYHCLTVVDFDKVERGNLGTQNFDSGDIGKKKAVQIATRIFRRISVKVNPIDKRLDGTNMKRVLEPASLVIDVFDNVESREIVRKFCADNQIECLHAGLSELGFCEILWNERYHVNPAPPADPDGPCDYALATNLVIAASSLCAEVINQFVDMGKKIDIEFWLNNLVISKSP
jgi:molybdopterin/thiamine biosynthesis adenylyltransferase